MKKILFAFIFFVVLFSPRVYAQVTPTESITIPTGSTTPTPTPSEIDYQLPYPGILPGSPLYSLKMVRDRIMELLISDPLKKANFYILQADKRLGSSLMLFEKKENVIAETTLSKGLKYLEKAMDKGIEAQNKKQDVGDLFARIKNSATKQRQEMEKLGEKSKDLEGFVEVDLEKAKSIEKRAEALTP